jgi:hypothetical protein
VSGSLRYDKYGRMTNCRKMNDSGLFVENQNCRK